MITAFILTNLLLIRIQKNDLPLLSFADKAVCVCPDEILTAHTTEQGWDVVDWRI